MSVHVAKPEGSPPPRANIQMYQIEKENFEYSRTGVFSMVLLATSKLDTAIFKASSRASRALSGTSASNLEVPLDEA